MSVLIVSVYGTVKAAKVISDRAGVSKGYGFVTFETEEEAKRPLRDVSSISHTFNLGCEGTYGLAVMTEVFDICWTVF